MKKKEYILGLDLGTSSLGWAVIEKTDGKPSGILNAGSTIFPQGVPSSELGKGKGKEKSNNADRRDSRQMRRQLARRRLRKQHLLKLLIDKQMCPLTMEELEGWSKWDKSKPSEERRLFPTSERFHEWLSMDPYRLRAEAVDRTLEDDPDGGFTAREKMGRILYAIIQHRGFLSSRKGKEDGTIFTNTLEKNGKSGILETKEALKERTLGQYLYSIAPKSGEPYKDLDERVRSRYTLRDMYVEELEQIWETQAEALGLDEETVSTTHHRFFTGSTDSREVRRRLARYLERDPEAHIETIGEGEHQYVYTSTLPLKEHLMGKVWYDDEGKLRYLSKESTLFWQRPLRSQKGLLDKCAYESYRVEDPETHRFVTQGPTVVSASHPYFEVYRVLQFLHNLRINEAKPDQMLLQSMLDRMLTYERSNKLLKLIRDLKINVDFNYPSDSDLPACPTIAGICKIIKKAPKRPKDSDSISSLTLPIDLNLYSRIWEKIFSHDDNHLLAQNLRKIEGVDFVDDLEDKLDKVSLADSYSNVSLHALRNIIPYMLRGEEHYAAVLLGGIRNAVRDDALVDAHDHELREWIKERGRMKRGEMMDAIVALLQDPDGPFHLTQPEYKIRRKLYHPSQATEKHDLQPTLPPLETLRNPLVEQTLWAMRRQVNYLLDYYRTHLDEDFHFDQIHVELARDLKASAEGRKKMRDRQRENQELNDTARDALRGLGLRPSRENLQKYKLYMEIAERNNGIVICPYTGKTIKGITDALGSKSRYQIEHIVPRAVTNDDSLSNKTLCEAVFNRKKGNLTPYQYYQINSSAKDWGVDTWDEVVKRAYRILPYRKAQRFVSEELDTDLTSDQLVDTAYMSRKAKEYLTYICPTDSIRVYPGKVTAELRRLWGLNRILSDRVPIKEITADNAEARIYTEDTAVLVVADKRTGDPLRILPKYAPRPTRIGDDLILLVRKSKGQIYTARYTELPIVWDELSALEDGMYYLHLRESEFVRLERMFEEVPRFRDDLLRAKVTVSLGREGSLKLSSDQLDTRDLKDLQLPLEPGNYWLTIPLREVPVVEKERPRTKVAKGQLKVTGVIRQGNFVSRVYRQDQVTLQRGVAQAILDPIQEEATFIKIKREVPEIKSCEVVVTCTVDEREYFTCHQDPELRVDLDTFGEKGQFYAVFAFDPVLSSTEPYLCPAPELTSDQVLIEGVMVSNEEDGKVYFSPDKNRGDHRHHALDAIVIACAGQQMLTEMSTYHARRDDIKRESVQNRSDEVRRPVFPSPWSSFQSDAERVISGVLVKHKQSNKVLNKVSKTIYKDGRKHISEGLALRGQLHKETFYGERQSPHEVMPTMHYRVSIESINTSKLVDQVVDPSIRRLMRERLEEMGIDVSKPNYSVPGDAFKDKEGRYTIYLNNKNGAPVPVKKVRRSKTISETVRLGGFNKEVETRNNHHILVYESLSGEIKEEVVTFWEVADRMLRHEPAVKLPVDAKRLIACFRKNDMFVIGMTREELDQAILAGDTARISRYLYRVQKLSSGDLNFRVHTASTIDNDEELIRIRSLKVFSDELAPIPVTVDTLGHLSVKDYDEQ